MAEKISKAEHLIKTLFQSADIEIGGTRPWDIRVNDVRFYTRVLSDRSLGLGESYMDGWWECDQLDEFFYKLLSAKIQDKVMGHISLTLLLSLLKSKLLNLQTKTRALEVGEKHYDIGNDFYSSMLDARMVYTSGYWRTAKNLNEAQEAKMDLICKKAGLKPGMRVLDIGCGWGSFVKFATEKYGVSAVGITISKEQLVFAKENVKGLDVEIRFQDYRDVDEQFDVIVSIEMFEAVGQKNYREYMRVAHKNLKQDGVFVLQTIGTHDTTIRHADPWLEKYIFPNGTLPSQAEITTSIEKLFTIEDWENFGNYYDRTLLEWYQNFEQHWPRFKEKYGDRFYRMWKYYLLCCAGSFRARYIHVWQIVMTKN